MLEHLLHSTLSARDGGGFTAAITFSKCKALAVLAGSMLFILLTTDADRCRPLEFGLHRGVPMVLHCVVSTTRQLFRDLGPAVAILRLHCHDDIVFFRGPRTFFDCWVELVVPPLTTLLAIATGQVRCNHRPFACAMRLDKLHHFQVFSRTPRLLHSCTMILKVIPPLIALQRRPMVEKCRDELPFLATVLVDRGAKLVILCMQRLGMSTSITKASMGSAYLVSGPWLDPLVSRF